MNICSVTYGQVIANTQVFAFGKVDPIFKSGYKYFYIIGHAFEEGIEKPSF